jgi:hypothetical protein
MSALLSPEGNGARSFECNVFEAEDLHWM